jgi:hypothetical protein
MALTLQVLPVTVHEAGFAALKLIGSRFGATKARSVCWSSTGTTWTVGCGAGVIGRRGNSTGTSSMGLSRNTITCRRTSVLPRLVGVG